MSYIRVMCSVCLILWDYDQYLAKRLKQEGLTKAEARALEEAREQLHRLVKDHQGGELAA